MSVQLDCECGKSCSIREEQLGRVVKCPFCGKRHKARIPATKADGEFTDAPENVDTKTSREPLFWLGFAFGLIVLAVISIVTIDRFMKMNADRYVAEKVREARILITARRPEEAIGLLEGALGTPNASNLSSASRLLEAARAAKADTEDAKLIEKADRWIDAGEFEPAVRSLTARLSLMADPNKAKAEAIMGDVRRATSRDNIIHDLSTLTDAEVAEPSRVKTLIEKFETKYDSLRETYRRNIMAAIPEERTRREEVKRRAEAERLARLEAERLKKLEQERIAKEAAAKEAAEQARIAAERKAKEAELAAREERRRRSFKGSGQEATSSFSLVEGLAVMELKHRGQSNFIVTLMSDAGDRILSLANLIGSCSISRAVRIPRNSDYLLSVKADGAWEITIDQPLPREMEFEFFFDGEKSSATRRFKLLEGLCRIKLKHRGESNFIVTLLDENGVRVSGIVNEIGAFEGSQAIKIPRTGTYVFDIQAGGPWSIEVE
jgi:hypothetical protein